MKNTKTVRRKQNRPARAELAPLPKTMRAVAIERNGGPEVLTLHTLPVPELSPKEVLIAVHTAGVGGWDADIRDGWHPGGRIRFPLILGVDGSGTIVKLGRSVRGFDLGDRVYSYSWNNPKGGFYAEYVAVQMHRVARCPIPPLDLTHAGAVPTTGLTALQGIGDHLDVQTGEHILIHGASGGVGTLAIQFAKERGAQILAIASGEDGVALAERLGADLAVDGHREDVVDAAFAFTPKGVDAALVLGSGESVLRCLDALRPGGRLAYPNGVEPVPEKRRGMKIISYDAKVGVREFERLNRAIRKANLQVPIAGEFPLEDAAKAHQRMEQGHVLGKIILRIG
jgi:NADPH:quinone reductase-like Zn-dependent oxidoreductase